MRRVALAVLLVAGVVLGLTRVFKPVLVVPLNRTGGDLCQFLDDTANLTGTWLCFRGDGTTYPGSVAISRVGTPVTVNTSFYPVGPDRGFAQAQQTSNGNYWETAAMSAPTGSFSVGCMVRNLEVAAERAYFGHWTAAANSIYLQQDTSSAAAALKLNDGTGTSTISTGAVTPGAWHLIAFSFGYAAPGASNTVRPYLDGVLGTLSSTARPPAAQAGLKWVVGGLSDGTLPFGGQIGGCFLTEKVLDATTMAQMGRRVSGLRGFKGAGLSNGYDENAFESTVTLTRTTTAVCVDAAGAVVTLAPGQPCMAGGLLVEPAATNLLLQSTNLVTSWTLMSNATLPDGGAPTRSANTADVTAPDGTSTAAKYEFPTTTGTQYAMMVRSSTGTAATYTDSVWARTLSGTSTLYLYQYTGAYSGKNVCTLNLTSVWRRFSCPHTETAATWFFIVGSEGGQVPLLANQTVYLWGAQRELGTLSSHVVTAGTTAQRNAVVASVPNGLVNLTPAPTQWCIGGTVVPSEGGAWANGTYAMGRLSATSADGDTANLNVNTIGLVVFSTYDVAMAIKYVRTSSPISYEKHEIVGCSDNGTLTIWLDGNAVALEAPTGSGTGIITTQPPTYFLGSLGFLQWLPGSFSNFFQSIGTSPPFMYRATIPAVDGGPALTYVSDSFNRANSAYLGVDWLTQPGTAAPTVTSDAGLYAVDNQSSGARWVTGTWPANQFVAGYFAPDAGCGATALVTDGLTVRASDAAQTYYAANISSVDGGAGACHTILQLNRVVAGAVTPLGGEVVAVDAGAPQPRYVRLVVDGTALTVSHKAAAGDSWVNVISQSDATISSGSGGFLLKYFSVDNWQGGSDAGTGP